MHALSPSLLCALTVIGLNYVSHSTEKLRVSLSLSPTVHFLFTGNQLYIYNSSCYSKRPRYLGSCVAVCRAWAIKLDAYGLFKIGDLQRPFSYLDVIACHLSLSGFPEIPKLPTQKIHCIVPGTFLDTWSCSLFECTVVQI